MKTLRTSFLVSILLLIAGSISAFAQSSAVPISDPVYRVIDRMVGSDLIRTEIVGQRPYTRLEVGRLLHEAEGRFETLDHPVEKMTFRRLLDRYTGLYAHEVAYWSGDDRAWRLAPFLRKVSVDLTGTDSLSRVIPSNNVGTIDARIDPLTDYQRGRLVKQGGTISLEALATVEGPWVAMTALPRFQVQTANDDGDIGLYPIELNAKTGYKNIELSVGRETLVWGQSEHGGLLFTDHARGVDVVRLSSPYSFQLPSFLRHLGYFKGSMMVGTMGVNYNRKNAALSGLKLSWLPARFVEVGMSYAVVMGGEGGPHMGASDVAREMFGFVPGVGRTDNDFSNKLAGLEFRFRIPPLSAMEVYGECLFDDKNFNNTHALFVDKMGFLSGLYFPRLGSLDHIGTRLEYRHTPAIFYRHSGLVDGWALGGRGLGDPIGSDANAISSTWYYDLDPAGRLGLDLAYARYRGNTYGSTAAGDINIVTRGTSEKRWHSSVLGEFPIRDHWMVRTQMGYERVSNFNFVAGRNRNHLLGSMTLSVDIGSN